MGQHKGTYTSKHQAFIELKHGQYVQHKAMCDQIIFLNVQYSIFVPIVILLTVTLVSHRWSKVYLKIVMAIILTRTGGFFSEPWPNRHFFS